MTHLTIYLSEAPPVRITPDTWPLIASFTDRDGFIDVRQHADGRTLVYGSVVTHRTARAGFLCDAGPAHTVRAIRRVAGVLRKPQLGDGCIALLPPQDLT